MATGTFIIRPTVLVSGGTPIYDYASTPAFPFGGYQRNSGNDGSTILQWVNNSIGNPAGDGIVYSTVAPFSFNDTLRFSFTGTSIYLDGSGTPIAFATLPAGFTPLSASAILLTGGPSISSNNFNLQHGTLDNGPAGSQTYPYDFTFPPSMLRIWANGIGIKLFLSSQPPPNPNNDGKDISNFRIEGTYTISSYGYSITNSPVTVGNDVIITATRKDDGIVIPSSPDGSPNGPFDFDLSTLFIEVVNPVTGLVTEFPIPPSAVTFRSDTEFIFTLPIDFPFSGFFWLYAVFDDDAILPDDTVLTSRAVPLGLLEILLYGNVSGIYRLVDGKKTDTIYRHDGTTTEIKIPDPFGKVGFVGN